MMVEEPSIELLPDGAAGPRRFKIKAVDNEQRRSKVDALLKERYGWRGYKSVSLPTDSSVSKFTLAAIEDDLMIGSITVSLDGPDGLAVDDIFGPEAKKLRAQGRRLSEFVRLAVDPLVGTKRVLGALFHVAYIVAHRIRGYDTLLIEVNPRHVHYYQRMLGFKPLSEERTNRSVNAPAVLMALEFSYLKRQIGEFGGQPERMATERSLYPAAFSLKEEASIIERMLLKQSLLDERNRLVPRDSGLAPPSDFQASDLMS